MVQKLTHLLGSKYTEQIDKIVNRLHEDIIDDTELCKLMNTVGEDVCGLKGHDPNWEDTAEGERFFELANRVQAYVVSSVLQRILNSGGFS